MKLTKPQKLVYDMEQFAGGAIAVICGSMLMEGECSQKTLAQAIHDLYRLNDALRMHIVHTNEDVELVVAEYTEKNIDVLCFEDKAQLDSYASDYAKISTDLHGDLCEIKIVELPGQYGILVKMHHLIGDAWTLSLLGSQLQQLLNEETPEAYSYTEYESSEAAYLASKRCEKDKAFFMEQFAKCEEVTYLSDKQVHSYAAERKTVIVEADEARVLADYMAGKNTTAFPLFMTALAIYMSRIKLNVEKFYIGTAVLNRTGNKEKNTMGMYINTVPMLMELNNENTFAENLACVEEAAFGVFRHQKYNYGDVLTDIRKEYSFSEKLYDIMLSYQNAALIGAAESTWYHSGMQTESLQIHIDDRDNKGVFRIHYDYQIEKFTVREIERMHRHIMTLLLDAISNEDKKIRELSLLTQKEEHRILEEFNNTQEDHLRDKCVHTLFEEQVARTPNKTAVIACDTTLTYKELDDRANQIANGLIEAGVVPGDIVAFMLPRTSNLIATMFGILKTGAAYLPVDPDYPEERVSYMLEDSKANLCVTASEIEHWMQNHNTNSPSVEVPSSSICYCIYTSGSTGKPKAVLIAHSNVNNFVTVNDTNSFQKKLVEGCDVVLCVNSIVFDIVLQEIHIPLTNGLTVRLLPHKTIPDWGDLQMDRVGLICTPTKLSMYMQDEDFCHFLKNCSIIMCGAEAFPEVLYGELRALTDAVIYNGYGPTEITCGASYAEIKDSNDIHIGRPIANTQFYIVDRYMNLCSLGISGELCIAGNGVGVGYLNRPELTAEKFVDNPFGEGKLYKTGDLAYWREDGNIAYVGRNDFQVKIRGLRIELGEIENAIDCVDGISQAVVVVRKNAEGRQLICAFYTQTAPVPVETIRSELGKKLPRYMLPHIFTVLNEMPLTSSGKVNRKALPEIDLNCVESSTVYVKPEGELEKQLAKLMEQALGYAPVGRNDHFFDLGGDSLKAIEMISKAHTEGIYVSLQNVFDYPTVQQLADCIVNGDKQVVSFEEMDFSAIDRILAKNCVDGITKTECVPLGNILLAGATGFLGSHILVDFLEHDSGTAYCLVRGKDEADSKNRLYELLRHYFGETYVGSERIKVICADLQKDCFGLSEKAYSELLSSVDTVINTAASVKHYGSYRYFYEVNVESVHRLIQFCKEADVKLIHTSTISVSGNSFADQFDGYVSKTEKHFYESSLYIGQPLDNVYARSKFEAEKAILDAMQEGLRANIMRMGNLTNRLSDGMFQRNHESNAFLKRIRGALELGMLPNDLLDGHMEFTPVDEAAKAIMTIARHFSTEFTVFHINTPKTVSVAKLTEYFRMFGYSIDAVYGTNFETALKQTANQAGLEHIFEAFVNDMDETGHLNYDSNIRIKNSFTVQYLKMLDFEWSDIEFAYFSKYVRYFEKMGYWRIIDEKTKR